MNIGEIAKRAGVSRSTVSYALSRKRTVSDETRAKIQRVIDELGYRPNASARALANGRTNAIALVFPPAGDHYTGMQLDFIGSVVEAAATFDYDVLLSPSGVDSDRSFQRLLGERRVDGAILMEIRLQDDRVDHLFTENFPAVCIGRTARPEADWWVGLDHTALAAACVQHLADLGHRKVAFVNRPERLLRAGYESAHRGLDGFTKAAAERGLSVRTYNCGDDASSGQACVERILHDDPATTALVTLNEAALGGLYRGLAHAGRHVPRDFSVTGVAAARWAETVTPQLTAADVPASQMGRLAVELLVERLDRPDGPPRHHLLAPSISLRASTGPVGTAPSVLRRSG
ncbi:LacI family DNA-binding transcriptional regulator [Streptomyces violaceusniger]|uniref:Transcriptional regulator, LacI family n=1 Tax=Streptomyces violaceusniger (strain Tu 4113) TaxID=653045 RepID=G2P4Y6_STRV4|nr:LacI family DNA-binding transcriptional regulator [Streptomyces violaceusniger]AEM84163.1 transcriptional regulator, LacI family [Streptomyces violaceusniger Tu 4113]